MNITWNMLDSEVGLEQLVDRSFEVPCLIFKHSTRCNISSIAKYRLEDDWSFDNLETYYLDLIQHRSLSATIAERFSVHPESPQVLLIIKGECVYDASHLDISIAELREALESENSRQNV
jgi:bacillithiol system protein YtxJ